MPALKPLVHGTYHGYHAKGCRCPACHEAAKAYSRDAQARRRANNPEGVRHNKLNGMTRESNRTHYRDYQREYRRRRLASDPTFKLLARLRGRLGDALRATGARKSARTLALLGCDVPMLKQWLAAKFSTGMTWENYGKWHVDHIIPCASFDLTDPEQQRRCFHYTNLQPLWAVDNHRKGAKLLPQENAHV